MSTVGGGPGDTLAALLADLGSVPASRVLRRPFPGTATEADVLRLLDGANKRVCELIDGVLVEKAVGTRESLIASVLAQVMGPFARKHGLGVVLVGDGLLRLLEGVVRAADVAFIANGKFPGGELPEEPVWPVVPDLAVEVLSPGNTRPEMARKRKEYFLAGVEEVWLINPKTQTAEVYTSPEDKRRVGKTGSLTGGQFLPGFELSLQELFGHVQVPKKKYRRGGAP